MSGTAGNVSVLSVCRFRVDLWLAARSLPWRISGKPLEQILAMASPADRLDYHGLSPDYISRRVRKAARRPVFMRDRRCLREGLLGFEFLRRAGYDPELHFAVEPSSIAKDRIAAHCWVCLDGQPIVGDRQGDQVTILIHRSQADRTVH